MTVAEHSKIDAGLILVRRDVETGRRHARLTTCIHLRNPPHPRPLLDREHFIRPRKLNQDEAKQAQD